MPTLSFSLSSFYDFWMKPNPLLRPAPGRSALGAVCANLAKEFVLFCFNVKKEIKFHNSASAIIFNIVIVFT